MRTALILLFLLAVAAVPASLLPQRPLNPANTTAYIASHGGWGRLLDRIGIFDVFGSAWFAAIYLLLGLSLVGCLVLRLRVHARAVARNPLPAPRNLSRLPEFGQFDTVDAPEQFAAGARAVLGRRWRVVQRGEDSGAVTLSAEKGYLRESGNLIFHIALLIAVTAIAADRLYAYEGSVIVQQGHGFCNTAVDLDALRTGRLAQGQNLAPFCVDELDRFTAGYTLQGEATSFAADISYSLGIHGGPRHATIRVNHPLRIDGDRVYLTGHGFAPQLTVHMPDGSTRRTTVTFLPRDAALTSDGAIKLQGAGVRGDIGIEGVFAPNGVQRGGVLSSATPQPVRPALAIIVYRGDLGLGFGLPQSVYSLDPHQKATGALRRIGAATLIPGQSTTLPGGVRVTFDGYTQWVNFQISHNPAQFYLLLAAALMVAGLSASLTIRRRRIWLRITPANTDDEPNLTSVHIGGLARSDSGTFNTEFGALLQRLRAASTPTRDLIDAGRH